MQHRNRLGEFDRKRFYTLLRVGKEELGWDDEFYYGIFLPSMGASKKDGVKYSATTLSNTQLFTAVERMKDKGFKVKQKSGNVSVSADGLKAVKAVCTLADDGQSRKIRALWLELHGVGHVRNKSEASLLGYVKAATGIDRLEWLSTAQASNVIERLKKWLKRPVKAVVVKSV